LSQLKKDDFFFKNCEAKMTKITFDHV